MKQLEYWQWWLVDDVDGAAGTRHKSHWKMTAEEAADYPGAMRVEGTLEIRSLPETKGEPIAQPDGRHRRLRDTDA